MPGMNNKKKTHKSVAFPVAHQNSKGTYFSEVECGVEFPGQVADSWRDVSCKKCLAYKPKD